MDLNLKQIVERVAKTNDQRMKMAFTLVNVMKHTEHSSLSIRSSIAAAMIDMLDTSMIEEDGELINLMNDAIDGVCEEAKEHGVMDLRSRLREAVAVSNQMVAEKINRVNEGNEILSKLDLNNLNLN